MRDTDFIKDEEARGQSISNAWWEKPLETRRKIQRTLSEAHTGIYPSESSKKKMSESQTLRQESLEYRKRHSERMSPIIEEMWKRPEYRKIKIKQLTESSKKNWNDPEWRRKILKAQNRQPSSDEELITYLLNENFPTQWEYTGNKSFVGGGSKSPDWTHTFLKKVLEYDEYYWHVYKRYDDSEEKIKYYANLGYNCLIVTNLDLWVNLNTFIQMIKEFSTKEEDLKV